MEKDDKTVRSGLSKVCMVNFNDISSTQQALHAEKDGLGHSSASLLALLAFWPQLLVRVTFSRQFSRKDSKMFRLTNEQERTLDGIQKNWTQNVYV